MRPENAKIRRVAFEVDIESAHKVSHAFICSMREAEDRLIDMAISNDTLAKELYLILFGDEPELALFDFGDMVECDSAIRLKTPEAIHTVFV